MKITFDVGMELNSNLEFSEEEHAEFAEAVVEALNAIFENTVNTKGFSFTVTRIHEDSVEVEQT